MRRNADPVVHPFERAREYTRALNAVKLERLFSKPFVGQLGDGHVDGVYTMQKHGRNLCRLVSGGADGYVKVWHTGESGIKGNSEKCDIWRAKGHEGIVRGVAFLHQEHQVDKVISCGDDGAIRLWEIEQNATNSGMKGNGSVMSLMGAQLDKPVREWGGVGGNERLPLTHLDSHPKNAHFATTGSSISIWHAGHASQSAPIQTFRWGEDTFYSVRYHPVETHLLAATASDRSILLLDTRLATPIHRVVMALRSNAVRWHPREPFNFASGSDDHHAYLWDMRKLQLPSSRRKEGGKAGGGGALAIYKDHVGPVMDLD
jgi:DDB1- and CUL4-associated factor 13